MADIASFIAEDFERRMKKWEKGEQHEGFEFSSTVAVASSVLFSIGTKLDQQLAFVKDGIEKNATEPRNSFSLAAFNGFFSA
ncbi:uncharacterized protein LOC110033214 [Phalaenopsis equestris]|uniref:uncharacterized protein LOC110033214 n=1 Tax=Phalaenopsis equestris TaxID=78828 RepID=UPI0009E38D4C|nr:uncharacterized protein LOC110033214 [Phalaenopsis equestris]